VRRRLIGLEAIHLRAGEILVDHERGDALANSILGVASSK
jgi:hypothetical protein